MSMNNDSTACARTLSTARRQAPRLIYCIVLYACVYPRICCNPGSENGHVLRQLSTCRSCQTPTLEDIATGNKGVRIVMMLRTTPAILMYLPAHFMFAAGCCIPWPVTRAMQVPG
jgi:hypothetical protein